MSCRRKLALCCYCVHEDDYCPGYSGWCFTKTEKAKKRLAELTIGQGKDGTLYRIENEADLSLVRVTNYVDWDNWESHGPGIYEQYYDDNCAYAMPTENLEFRRPL